MTTAEVEAVDGEGSSHLFGMSSIHNMWGILDVGESVNGEWHDDEDVE